MRRADQSPIKSVRPRMVRTLNRRHMSTCVFPESRPAMTTNIVKPANGAALIANNDQTFASHLRSELIPALTDLTLMPD